MKMSRDTLKMLHDAKKNEEPTVDGWPLYSGLPQPEPRVTEDMWKKLSELQQKVMEIAHIAPTNKEWVGLTDYEIVGIASLNQSNNFSFARAIEAKLKEKNND